MAILKSKEDKTKIRVQVVVDEAQKGWDAGQRFYILEAGSSFTGAASPTICEMLGAVEDIGWRLEHVSHVWSDTLANHAVGYYVFRRS